MSVAGYEYWIECPDCGYQTDASKSRYYDDDWNLICGADDGRHRDKDGCGARLNITVEVVGGG